MSEPRVKICGITRPEDARTAAEAGADYLGVVLVPDTPRAVSPARARRIRGELDVPLALVCADLPADALVRAAREAGARVLQLQGAESPDEVGRLREAGDWTIWKCVRVRRAEEVDDAVDRYGAVVDALHLDAWDPRRLGGTGSRFDWRAVREARERIPEGTGVVAAGGLTPENVAEAIEILRPDVVDVSSGVEAGPGVKDPDRIRAFVRAVHAAAGGRTASTTKEAKR